MRCGVPASWAVGPSGSWTFDHETHATLGQAAVHDVVEDGSGNLYICGDPASSGDGNNVRKLNASGAEQWGVKIGSGDGHFCFGIALDSSGNVYVGHAHDTTANVTQLNPSTGATNWTLDANTGGFSADAYQIALDSNDNLLVSHFLSSGNPDQVLWQYNSGSKPTTALWSYAYSGDAGHKFRACTIDSSDLAYFADGFFGRDQVEQISGGSKVWSYAHSASIGRIKSVREFGDHIWIAGQISDTTDRFNARKLDKSGNLLGSVRYTESGGTASAGDVLVRASGAVYVAGDLTLRL